jgi:lipoprotein signal peptidase
MKVTQHAARVRDRLVPLPATRDALSPRRRRTDLETNHGWRPALAILLVVAMLDWMVKIGVASAVQVGDFVEVWEGRIALWHLKNPDMVLGLWGNFPIQVRMAIAVLAVLCAILLAFHILYRGHRLLPHRRPWAWLFVGLAFGGMLGNLGERLIRWSVTDYLSFAWGEFWLPPGNVADVALLLSMPLAAAVVFFELEARALRRPRVAAQEPTASAAPVCPPSA